MSGGERPTTPFFILFFEMYGFHISLDDLRLPRVLSLVLAYLARVVIEIP